MDTADRTLSLLRPYQPQGSGFVSRVGEPHASYFVHWTVGHVFDHGAHFDLIIRVWGDGTSAAERTP